MVRYHGLSRSTVGHLIKMGVPRTLLLATAFLAARSGQLQRDLDMVEMYAGEAQLCKEATSAGLKAIPFEVTTNKHNNVMTDVGFLRAATLILRLKHGAVLWCGTPCSTWVFMSRGSTRRSATEPLGDEHVEKVRVSNCLVARTVLLTLLAIARGVAWAWEQPISSLMTEHPRVKQLRRLCVCLSETACM